MNNWIRLLIVGLSLGIGGSAASLLIGWVMPSDALIRLSMILSIGGWIAGMIGIVGFLVTKGGQGNAEPG